ncbi:MAG: hypothetical protein FJ291_14175 [Planctomycetes bacterium]|nr:hypothetical protein [Planctomycetota bacterium]
MRRNRLGVVVLYALLAGVVGGAAIAGAPDASLIGPTRGALDIVLPYYPQSARAAALGRGTVALPGADSHNPAALGFFKEVAKADHDLAISYGRASFDHGPDLDIYNANLVFPMPMLGGYSKLMAFGIDTRQDDLSRMLGAKADVSAYEFGMAYGSLVPLPDRVPGKLALGFAGFPLDPSHLKLEVPGGPTMARAKGWSKVGSIRLGALYQPEERLNLGVVFTHIKDYAWAKYPGLAIPGRFSSIYHVNIWEFGASFRPLARTIVLVQFLHGRANGEGVHTTYDVLSLGVEHEIPITSGVGIALRGGWLDNGPTFGLGATLPARCRLDYAFIPHYGEGVKAAFGHTPLHVLTFGKSF